MAGALDTGLQVVHYLARRVSFATPDFVAGRTVLLGEIPPTAVIQGVSVLVTAAWTGCNLNISKNADLSNPCFGLGSLAATGFLGVGPLLAGGDSYIQTGRLYMGSVGGTTGPGSGIVLLRYFPRFDPLGFG